MAISDTTTDAPAEAPVTTGFWALTLGSIGVVFGDIGTSPLYAFREAVAGAAGHEPVTRIIVLGVLSLILWALFIVVTAKYVLLLLRADNNGEGGTLSLMTLGQRALGRRSWPMLALGVIGASMFIGDSMITPAISVLSAVGGLLACAAGGVNDLVARSGLAPGGGGFGDMVGSVPVAPLFRRLSVGGCLVLS